MKQNRILYFPLWYILSFNSDIFIPPIKTTQCGHNFCERCLDDIFNRSRRHYQRRWACPDCRQEHDCSVDSLPRSFLIEKMVEKFKKSSECGFCPMHGLVFEIRKFRNVMY